MTGLSLAARVAALEEKVGNKTLQEQFREQAELIDRRLDESFREQAELLDRRFLLVDKRFDRVDGPLAVLRKEMTIVREGIGILLRKLR